MKKLIYLPIIALIILSGCKGNSFMTQRYTHLKHNPPQTAVLAKPNERTSPLYAGQEKAGGKTGKPVAAQIPATAGTVTNPPGKKYSVTVRNADEEVVLIKRAPSLSKPGIGKADAGNVLKTGYKSIKENIQSSDGVISTTLKIVLFAIGLAIIVALIILVILLGG